MACPECVRITIEYESLERTYAAAIENLTARPNARANEYQRLRKMADKARLDAEVGRLELEKHLSVHI